MLTKMQIAAKCLLTGLVVYAVILLARPLTGLPAYSSAENTPLAFLLLGICVVLLIAAGLYIVTVVDRLLPRITAGDEPLAPDQTRRLLAQALPLTMVLVGLVLLPRSVPTIVATVRIPFILRPIITEAIIDRDLSQIFNLSGTRWGRHLYDIARMLLVLYLLCGAPRFVRWQIARTGSRIGRRADEDERLGNG